MCVVIYIDNCFCELRQAALTSCSVYLFNNVKWTQNQHLELLCVEKEQGKKVGLVKVVKLCYQLAHALPHQVRVLLSHDTK